MAPFYDPNQTTGTLTLPPIDPPTWQQDVDQSENDVFRLGRELARDFEDQSFSSVLPPGEETSFDIARNANATSTRRLDPIHRAPGGPPDFTMAAEHNELTADSYEVGRARNAGNTVGVSFMDQTADLFSIGESTARKNESKKRAATSKAEERRTASEERAERAEQKKQERDRRARSLAQDKSLGSPMQRSSPFHTLYYSPNAGPTPKPQQPRTKTRLSAGSQEKVKDNISNPSSGGKASKPAITSTQSEEDALSGLDSDATRQSFNKYRRKSAPVDDMTEDIPVTVGRNRKTGEREKNVPKSFKSTPDFLKELGLDGHTQTLQLQQQLKALKDTGAATRPRKQTTQAYSAAAPTPGPSRPVAEPSFMIPNMPDMTDLFAGNEPTRFSAKKGAAAYSHHPLDSIPIPHETRAMLTAMKMLQEKVANLEGHKAAHEQKYKKLENELKRAEAKYQQETRRARVAEEQLRRRRNHAADSTFGGSEDFDFTMEQQRSDWVMEKHKLESTISNLQADLEHIQHELHTAKIALRNMQDERNAAINSVAVAISSNEDLKAINEDLRQQLEQMEYEKRRAEKRTDKQREEYTAREQRLRQYVKDARQATHVAEQAMQEASSRDARDARNTQQRTTRDRKPVKRRTEDDETQILLHESAEEEREERRRNEVQEDFQHRVEAELKRIRPDLFLGRAEPFAFAASVVAGTKVGDARDKKEQARERAPLQNIKNKMSGALPERDAQGIREQKGKEKERERERERDIYYAPQPQSHKQLRRVESSPAAVGDETSMSISPEEIRRIAIEINAERKKRKAAAAAEKARVEEIERRQQPPQRTKTPRPMAQTVTSGSGLTDGQGQGQKGRKMVKVVYMLEGDTQEIRQMEQEIEATHQASVAVPQRTTTPGPAPKPAQELPVTQEIPKLSASEDTEEVVAGPSTATTAAKSGGKVTFTPTPLAPQHPLHDASHDPRSCTVCVRYDELRRREEEAEKENPLKDVDNSCVFPAPELEAASARVRQEGEGYEEEPTMRPSLCPKTQLERVVRQLKDEFRHLKLMYQRKSEEFMTLDPSIQKKRRKALTREMNELVAEMDAKSDQIYALYDVNEEFVEREKRDYDMGDETEDLIRSLQV
ncbi:Similar to Spindle pole body protein ppc89; acc. no. Q10218 [Pyronema omphalodes CBS 100304]|uniref:Similar to Spindle pole body protein ppc89 acc. no. Q10218 n=1 Tax=Pyronema omphalodes (strain CBS 100304) TaxID=1076935 RepID=U4LJD8_PYROM|nr:Similar to Spindle pole body protein ppc89; acc. no. Q10218 [Pyronema omphalodes CBS 100304]